MGGEAPDRNVYILGAGFSAPAGAPVIHDFLDRSRELFDDPSSRLEDFEQEHFERLFRFKRQMAQAREKVRIDLDNIEQLFGLVEISLRLTKTHREIRDSTAYVIAKTLEWATTGSRPRPRMRIGPFQDAEEWVRRRGLPRDSLEVDRTSNPSNYVEIDLYNYFANLVTGLWDDPQRKGVRRDSVITFNYDLVLDHGLNRVGARPDYCLDPALLLDLPSGSQARGCFLLKLHGSANWGVCANCRKSVIILSEKTTDSPKEFRIQRCPRCNQQNYQPLLVPPSWNKAEYREIMERVWAKAVEELKSATRICIIGYSMPESDAFFKYLLTLALAENHRLYKLIVVDLTPARALNQTGESSCRTPVEKRYRDILETLFQARRFDFYSEGIIDYLDTTKNDSLRQLGRGEILWDKTVCLKGRP